VHRLAQRSGVSHLPEGASIGRGALSGTDPRRVAAESEAAPESAPATPAEGVDSEAAVQYSPRRENQRGLMGEETAP